MAKADAGGAGLESYGVTILRVTLGIIYIMHAYLALFVFGIRGTVGFQRSLGLPMPEIGAWYVIVAHGVGSALLVPGLFTRWAALANLPIMAGAFFLVHLKQGMGYLWGRARLGDVPCATEKRRKRAKSLSTLLKTFM